MIIFKIPLTKVLTILILLFLNIEVLGVSYYWNKYDGPQDLFGWLPFHNRQLQQRKGVIVFKGQFVLYGSGDQYRSVDGSTWKRIDGLFDAIQIQYAFIYEDELYLKSGIKYYISDDLVNWRMVYRNKIENILTHAEDPLGKIGNYWYRKDQGRLYYSANNNNWKEIIIEGSINPNLGPILKYKNQYVIVGYHSDESGIWHTSLILSNDGVTWNTDHDLHILGSIFYSFEQAFAIGDYILLNESSGLPYMINGFDVDTFRKVSIPIHAIDMAVVNEQALVVGYDSVATADFETMTWKIQDFPVQPSFNKIVNWNDNLYALRGGSGSLSDDSVKVYRSTDGINWSVDFPREGRLDKIIKQHDPSRSKTINAIRNLYVENGDLIATRGRADAIYKKSGDTWISYPVELNDRLNSDETIELTPPVFFNNKYYAIDSAGAKIYETSDLNTPWLVSWDAQDYKIEGKLMVAGDSLIAILVVGKISRSSVLLKNSGLGWETLTHPGSSYIRFFNGKLIAFISYRGSDQADGMRVFSSTDGHNWIHVDIPDYGDGRLILQTTEKLLMVLAADSFTSSETVIMESNDAINWKLVPKPDFAQDFNLENATVFGEQIWFSGDSFISILQKNGDWSCFPAYAFVDREQNNSPSTGYENKPANFSRIPRGLIATSNGRLLLQESFLDKPYVFMRTFRLNLSESDVIDDPENSAMVEIHRVGHYEESFEVTVRLGGDAEYGIDYTIEGLSDRETIFFESGQKRVDITVHPISDNVEEGYGNSFNSETIVLELIVPESIGVSESYNKVQFIIFD